MAVPREALPPGLVAAILGRRQVRLRYPKDPRASAPRVLNPHAVSESSAGQVRLHGVQVAGPSSHGEASLPGWRSFDLGLVADLEVLPSSFQVAADFRPESGLYHRVIIDCLHGWHSPVRRRS